MTTAETSTLVFKNQAGDYFLVPQEILERGKVPAAQRAEIDRLLAEQDDVQGHFWALFLGLCLVGEAVAVGIGFGEGGVIRGGRGPERPL